MPVPIKAPVAARLHLVVFVLIKEAKIYCFMKRVKTRYQPCNLFFLIDHAMQSRGSGGSNFKLLYYLVCNPFCSFFYASKSGDFAERGNSCKNKFKYLIINKLTP